MTYLTPRGLTGTVESLSRVLLPIAAAVPLAWIAAFEGGGLAHSFGSIHTANDLLANMGGHAERSVPFAQLGLAFLGELAKGGNGPLDVIFADGFDPVPDGPLQAEATPSTSHEP